MLAASVCSLFGPYSILCYHCIKSSFCIDGNHNWENLIVLIDETILRPLEIFTAWCTPSSQFYKSAVLFWVTKSCTFHFCHWYVNSLNNISPHAHGRTILFYLAVCCRNLSYVLPHLFVHINHKNIYFSVLTSGELCRTKHLQLQNYRCYFSVYSSHKLTPIHQSHLSIKPPCMGVLIQCRKSDYCTCVRLGQNKL